MRRAVCLGQETGHGADELDRQAGDSDVGPDELEGAHREERRERVGDGEPPAQREARRHPDERLLGDADVHETFPQRRGNAADGRAVLGGQDDDARIGQREIAEKGLVRRRAHRTTSPAVTSRASSAP